MENEALGKTYDVVLGKEWKRRSMGTLGKSLEEVPNTSPASYVWTEVCKDDAWGHPATMVDVPEGSRCQPRALPPLNH